MQNLNEDQSSLTSIVLPKHIVVATDLSDMKVLLPYVIAQAKASSADVTLTHAIFPAGLLEDDGTVRDFDRRDNEAEQTLKIMASQIEADGIVCAITIKHGSPEEIVPAEIRRTGATRLIIGTHSHGYAGQGMLGSVANALLREVTVPVFVVGPQAPSLTTYARPQKILHSVSLKKQYREHVRFAVELAEAYQAELTLLHVMQPYIAKSVYVDKLSVRAKKTLAELIPTDLSSKPVVHIVVMCGELVPEMINMSTVTGVDLIVMAIDRDFPWWSRSNNAVYQVLAEVGCPVLVVRDHPLWSKDTGVLDTEHRVSSKTANTIVSR